MPFAEGTGCRLYYEETGRGYPIVFVHEFASDHRQWEAQVRFFSRRYRCIAFSARGYPPSGVPDDETLYGQDFAVEDIAAVMRAANIRRAYVVGLSMGGFATLLFGLRYPETASALVVASAGTGALKDGHEAFKATCQALGDRLIAQGWKGGLADETCHSPTRIQLKRKDPRAWTEFMTRLEEHSPIGSGLTMKRYQGGRDSVFDWEQRLGSMKIPTLLMVGDEDEPCIDTNIFLKKVLPNAGLWTQPRTGHVINLEEPDAFNQACQDFFAKVERGGWAEG